MAPIKIELQRGDILQTKSEVCVSSIHSSKDLSRFQLSKKVLVACGRQVQDELHNTKKGDMEIGEVEMTSAGSSPNIQKLLFLCLKAWRPGNEKILLQSILECLELASTTGHRSISFPALGMGGLRYPPEQVARALIEAVAMFNYQYHDQSQHHDQSRDGGAEASPISLETVYIVLLDENTDVIKAFLQMCADSSIDMQRSMPRNDPNYADQQGATSTTRKQRGRGAPQGNTQSWMSNTASSPQALLAGLQYSQSLGPLHFTVTPTWNSGTVGVQLNAGVQISFLKSFIPQALIGFLNQLTPKSK